MPLPLHDLFRRPKPIVAVLHVGPTPGVPSKHRLGCAASVRCAVDRAVAETKLLVELGVDGFLVENAHDVPAVGAEEAGPELVAYMTRVCAAVKRHAGRLPVGVRIMGGADRVAIAVAHAIDGDFVRAERWAHDAEHAGRLLRYRARIGADTLPILADLRAEDEDEAVALAHRAAEHRADGLVVLGPALGQPPAPEPLHAILGASELPVFAGGGLDSDNLLDFADAADGFLVGSALKENAQWRAPVCERRVRALIGAVEYARGQEVCQ